MKILVVGSGGREHALCWSFAKSPLCTQLFCAPGNPGIAEVAECLDIKPENIDDIVAAVESFEIEFVMVGPEVPLTLGLADKLRAKGVHCFGPSKVAAQLEGSKGYMKDMCRAAGVPTAEYERFTDAAKAKAYVEEKGAPIVIKADGLAAGKGVTVAQSKEEAFKAIDEAMVDGAFGDAGSEIVVEECLIGEEASFFAICNGDIAIPFTTAQDHKAVFDGDKGPNTGGMGAYSPAPIVDAAMEDRIMNEIINPTMKAMKKAGSPYTGMLFAGLMITKDGPKLIEYNVRFGDPETQAMLPRLKTDLLKLLLEASQGITDDFALEFKDETCLCVVIANEGYPGSYEKGSVIKNADKAAEGIDGVLFHAGTALNEAGELIATGGRVLVATAWAPTVKEAQSKAYEIADRVDWPKGFCRRDIGWRAV